MMHTHAKRAYTSILCYVLYDTSCFCIHVFVFSTCIPEGEYCQDIYCRGRYSLKNKLMT